MKHIQTLTAGIFVLALWSCNESASNPEVTDWPQASDGFGWPATKGDALVFDTVVNAEVGQDVKSATETLKSRYSPESVTYARVDLNIDGRAEFIVKSHHYGIAPSYAILTPNDSGGYSSIGSVSGDQVFRCEAAGGWLQLQGRGAEGQLRWLYSHRDGIYDLHRAERLDAASNTVTILPSTKAEQDGGGQPATRSESK